MLVIGLISKPLMVIVTMVNDMVGLRSSLELHDLLAILLCLESTLLRSRH